MSNQPKLSWSSVLNSLNKPTSISPESNEKCSLIDSEAQEKCSFPPPKTQSSFYFCSDDDDLSNEFTHVALPNMVAELVKKGNVCLRWEVIKEEIHEMKRVVREGGDVGDALKNCILGYNTELTCSFGVLYDMIELATDLFGDGEVREVVQFIGDACLGVDGIRNGVKLLNGVEGGGVERVELGRLEIVTLLTCGFMCTYPGRDGKCEAYADYPRINFDGLYDDKYRNSWGWGIWICCKKSKVHRLLCIFNYFRMRYQRMRSGHLNNISKVTFERRTLSDDETPEWGSWMKRKFCNLDIHVHGVLEDSTSMQIDFANKFIGGSTLGHGIRMEEIMFSQSPELIVAQLFTRKLDNNECMIVDGVERFSITEGYGTSFCSGEWQGLGISNMICEKSLLIWVKD